MGFKGWFLIGSGIVVLAMAGFTIFLLRQAATDEQPSRSAVAAEGQCAAQVKRTIELLTHGDEDKQSLTHVISSGSHYNHQLNICLVEVATFEASSSVYMKSLVSTSDNSAVLWLTGKRADGEEKQCFGADSRPLDCTEADKRWQRFMSQ